MKILTAEQTRQADAFTIENEPITSIDLMERASKQCFDWLIDQYPVNEHYTIFSGIGNNGGDGLAIARMLKKKGKSLVVYVVEFSKNYSPDFKENLDRLNKEGVVPVFLTEEQHHFKLNEGTIALDAIFGSGLTRPISGFIADVIGAINETATTTIAIDIPSGLFSDDNSANDRASIVKADYTLTFQHPKLCMLFPENYPYVGDFIVLNIGLDGTFIKQQESNYYYLTLEAIQAEIKNRSKFAHKGNYGHALLITGSKGKMGAGILAARACLRAGVGLLTVQVPGEALHIMQTSVPEAMCIVDDDPDIISVVADVLTYNAIGVGPGIGKEQKTHLVLKSLIQNTSVPLVIDADALNIIAENLTWLSFLPANSILTPHPKEFERLAGKWTTDEERLAKQKQLAIKNGVIVVLKGANTSICLPDGSVYFNSTGNPGMATGGSGDVLTGIITGLVAQGYDPDKAAITGVYLHGMAGDLAKDKEGENGLIASDIIDNITHAYQLLKR